MRRSATQCVSARPEPRSRFFRTKPKQRPIPFGRCSLGGRTRGMLVFGDGTILVHAADKADSVRELLARAGSSPVGVVGHGWLAAAFVEASELVQGLVDAEFERNGCDEDTPLQRSAMGLLTGLAGAIFG